MAEMNWFNYDTGKFEYAGPPQTDTDAKKYLPYDPSGTPRWLYDCYRQTGDSILGAMVKVLEITCGVTREADNG